MENQTNYGRFWEGTLSQDEYEDLLCQAKDAEMAAESAKDLKAADLLYIAQHPDEFTEA